MRRSLTVTVALLLSFATRADAHQLDEYVQASKIAVARDLVRVELRLTPGVKVLSRVLAVIDTNGDGILSPVEQRTYAERVRRDLSLAVDGRLLSLRLVTLGFPDMADMKEGLGEIRMDFEAAVPVGGVDRTLTFENQHLRDVAVYLANALVPQDSAIRIGAQRRSYEQASFTFEYSQTDSSRPLARATGASPASEAAGYFGMVRLGMHHIAEGTDHLLFLLVLLLPAPLAAVAGRWGRYAGARQGAARLLRIVTSFTIGHSLTLAAAASGVVRAPSGIVEVLIALSILVSAVHAMRPIFPGREALVAAGFGLVHGCAFATTIAGYGIDPWHTVLTVLGFNVGIELMQVAILVATVPWLLSLARTTAYAPLRVCGAGAGAVAALGWIGERAFGMANPIGPLVDAAASHGPLLIAALAATALLAEWRVRFVPRGSPFVTRR
ncbi:MAG TPA: HupE/UreJ family protein [Gemmatimonadaceae bacterium]